MIKTGTYVGNGVDDRNIDIGVNLAAKNNVYVIIKGYDIQPAVHRTEYGQGDLGMLYSNVDIADMIQSFTATGFQIGQHVNVNLDTKTYRYVVFWEEP